MPSKGLVPPTQMKLKTKDKRTQQLIDSTFTKLLFIQKLDHQC